MPRNSKAGGALATGDDAGFEVHRGGPFGLTVAVELNGRLKSLARLALKQGGAQIVPQPSLQGLGGARSRI